MNKRKIDDNETHNCNSLKRAKVAAEEQQPLKENVIRYYWMSSLEHLAAVKIAIALWSGAGIRDEIRKLHKEVSINCQRCGRYNEYPNLNELGQDIKDKVLDKILELSEFDVIRKILSDLVDPVGQEIFDWMEYQDRHVFDNYFYGHQALAVHYLDCPVWTSRGIIDYEETAKKLLAEKISSIYYKEMAKMSLDRKQSLIDYEEIAKILQEERANLWDRNRYNLACTYCLEEDAVIMIPNMGDRILYYNLNQDSKTMVHFWSAHLKGDLAILTQEICHYNMKYETEYSVDEFIFRELACNKRHRNNQVAIKFMWNRLSDEEKSRQILSVMKYSKMDLKCFFLSQMNEAQQRRVFKAEGRSLLLCLLDDWLWKDYFLPTMRHVWNIIPEMDFLRVVEDIVERRMEKHYEDVEEYNRYKAILKEVWRSAPKRLKEFIFEFQNGARGSGIFFGLLCARNMDMIQLMLPDINEVQKRAMIFSSRRNYRKCYWLIVNDQIDVAEKFIDDTLSAEKDVDMFKQKLVEGHGCDIAVHFIQNKKWDEVDQFMRWVFKSYNDKRAFKEKLSYSKICDDILESILVRNNEAGFVELENFFQWCASESARKVFELKREMYNVYFMKVHCKLIEEDKYPLLEKFLNWCFPNDEQEVELIKHRFYVFHKYIQIVQLVLNLVKKNNRLQSLEKFVRWCFTRNREITRFKKWILEPCREDADGVCFKLLREGMFKLADEFVQWCCNSSLMKTNKFKNNLMLCDNIKCLFTWHRHDEKMLGKVIKWINPSTEIFIQFREKFQDCRWLDCDIVAYLVRNQKWDEADQFIQWVFKSDPEIREFKGKLAHSEIRDEILESFVASNNNNEAALTELENFLQWCASENTVQVSEFKFEYKTYFMTEFAHRLITEDKYQLLEQFFNWVSPNDEYYWVKSKLFYGYSKHIQQLVQNLVEKNDRLQSLDTFVRWCFTKSIEIDSFKTFIRKPREDGVFIKLLRKGLFELADEFVSWCCGSSQNKISKFKNKLMLFDGIKCVFASCMHDYERTRKVIKWFNPSMETKIQFRKKFEDLRWVEWRMNWHIDIV